MQASKPLSLPLPPLSLSLIFSLLLFCFAFSSFTKNNGSAIVAMGSDFHLSGAVTLKGNQGNLGGAVHIAEFSRVYVQPVRSAMA